MKWEIITKEVIIDDKGTTKIIETPEQMDTVGNIYQKSGGVIPKACQKCKKEFNAVIKEEPIIQQVPIYKCKECDFENDSGDATLDHKILTDHKIKKISKSRLVSYKRTLEGLKANIRPTKNDCIILCDECLDNGD